MEANEDIHVQPPLRRLGMRVNGRNILTVGVSAGIGDTRNVVGKVLQGTLRCNPLGFEGY